MLKGMRLLLNHGVDEHFGTNFSAQDGNGQVGAGGCEGSGLEEFNFLS